jgi:hypothetical protein
MGLSALTDEGIEINLRPAFLRQAGVEDGGRLAASFTNLIRFERQFHDLSHRAALTACKTMREIARLGTAYG